MMDAIKQVFRDTWNAQPSVVVRAPGRVNLIGEHTDYNDGFVLPIAIDHAMVMAARPNGTMCVNAYSMDYNSHVSLDWDNLGRVQGPTQWHHYLAGMLAVWRDAGFRAVGFDAVLAGDVPQGAGLSSSAAFEVATGTLLNALTGAGVDGVTLALMAQKAENDVIGVRCGIMDQFVSAMGVEDAALLIDCRDLSYRAVSLQLEPHDLAIAVVHSGVRRGLVESAYNERREQCERGVALLGTLLNRSDVRHLRDVTEAEFKSVEALLPEPVRRRCRHVISENERVQSAVLALEGNDMVRFGALMNASHQSLTVDFEVSTQELDALVHRSWDHPGVLGARLTGAGFGGCVVVLLQREALDGYQREVLTAYARETGCTPRLWITRARRGAQVLVPGDRSPATIPSA
jgi:galactokinase